MKGLYVVFIIIYVTLSVFIANSKGYFAVRSYNVEKREDIQSYLNQNYNNYSYILLNKKAITSDLEGKFLDVKNLKLKRNPDMTLSVIVDNKEPIARTKSGKYISKDGIFYSSILNYPTKVEAKVDPQYISKHVLSENQVSFILDLSSKFNSVSIEVYEPYHFVIYLDSTPVEVPKDYENIANMSRVVEDIIVKSDKSISKLTVLNTRVVLK